MGPTPPSVFLLSTLCTPWLYPRRALPQIPVTDSPYPPVPPPPGSFPRVFGILSRTIITPPPNGKPPRNGPRKPGTGPPCLDWSVPPYVPHEVPNPHFLTSQENGGSGPLFSCFYQGTEKVAIGPEIWGLDLKNWPLDLKTWGNPLNPQKQARIRCGGQSLGFGPGFHPGSSVSSPSARLSYLSAANLYLTGTLQYTHTPRGNKAQ